MMNLFSSFDLYIFNSSFLSIFILIWFLSFEIFKQSLIKFTLNIFSNYMKLFFSSIQPYSSKKSLTLTWSIMLIILIINFCSVVGYVFPLSSQISMVLFLGLSLWSGFMLMKTFFNLKGFLAHCIPEGSPILLTIFLFLIEVVSNFIRPFTVSIRLVANILAGHLLMVLLYQLVASSFVFFLSYLFLNLIEMGVAVIQSYIFVTMIWLYFSEI